MYNFLIVEDESIESESLRRIISAQIENAHIHEAATGGKAIQLIDQLNSIDLALVDINIPLPNGKEVIEYLRSKKRDTKVIVTTANDDFDIVRSMLNLKVDDYLLKPVKQSTLADVIRKVLNYDERDNVASRALKQQIFTLIDDGDFPTWNGLVLQIMNSAWREKQADLRQSVVDFLDLLNHYIAQREMTINASPSLTHLMREISTRGLTDALYYRTMQGVFTVSSALFDRAFKNISSRSDFIYRARFHIERNIFGNITLDDIAEKSFVSACYLSRAFKKVTGEGFSAYVTQRKMEIAKSLLQFSDLKVNTIALELAWQDANYFCRIFKRDTGMAPSDYRRLVG